MSGTNDIVSSAAGASAGRIIRGALRRARRVAGIIKRAITGRTVSRVTKFGELKLVDASALYGERFSMSEAEINEEIAEALESGNHHQALVLFLANRHRMKAPKAREAIVKKLAEAAIANGQGFDLNRVEMLSAERLCYTIYEDALDFDAGIQSIWSLCYQGDFNPDIRHWIHIALGQASKKALSAATSPALALWYLISRRAFDSISEFVTPQYVDRYEAPDLEQFLRCVFIYSDRADLPTLRDAAAARVAGFGQSNDARNLPVYQDLVVRTDNSKRAVDNVKLTKVEKHLTGSSTPIFIGYFGQIRYADNLFEKLIPATRAAFEKAGFTPTFACATWDRTGRQEIFDWIGMDFIYARLPSDLVPAVSSPANVSFGDFRKFFPECGNLIFRSNSSTETIELGRLQQQLGPGALLDISTEADFQHMIKETKIGRMNIEEPRLNQVRMFDRLAALGRLVERFNMRPDVASARYLFIRPDVEVPFSAIAQKVNSNIDRNAVYVDFDDQAELLGGIGDRYFAGDLEGVRSVSGTLTYLRSLAETTDYRALGATVHAHRFIARHLFRSNVLVRSIPASEIPLRIHRGIIPQDQLIASLKKDLAGPGLENDQNLRNRVARAIGSELVQ